MLKIRLRSVLLVLAILLAPHPAQSQNGGTGSQQSTQALTPAQAQQALEVLQDDGKRTQLIQTLQAIAKASTPEPAAAAAQPPTASSDNLGVQLLVQVSDWLGDVSSQLAIAARTVSDLPMIWGWLVQLATDPSARHTLLDAAWKLAVVLVCAWSVEWIVRRIIRRPLAALERYAPAPPRRRLDTYRTAGLSPAGLSVAGPTDPDHELRRPHLSLAYAWQLMLRFPFVVMRLILDLMPVASFAAIGNLLLATGIGSDTRPRVVILAMVNAYVLCRGILCATAALISPAGNQPSLFVIRDETAAYIGIWAKRIVTVTVFGVALANVALLLGLYRPAYVAAVRLVMLVVHLLMVVIILQCRRNVADLIRAPDAARGMLAAMRNRLADIWHILAIVLDLALWAVWALQVRNGYALLLQYFLATVAVLVIARLALMAVMAALDRIFRISPDFIRQFPGLEGRANRYLPVLRAVISGMVTVITIIALLEVWGIDAAAWFSSGQVGGRLISALVTIAIAGIAALAVWEASNAAIEQHLARLTREGKYMRTARLRTFLPMLRTTLLCVILTVVALTALSELGVNIAPLLAGAGIIGIAIGFGSQKLVQDLITGLFLLLENAMQVGDFVTVSGLSGVVENLSIRTIRLRASDGSIHIIPFSSVTSVTNTNRGIGNAAISVSVAYKEDTDRVGAVLKEIAAQMRSDPQFKSMIRGDLDLWGVDKVDASMATIVGQIQCTDVGRWPVQREFYRRMKKRFQELDIEIARPGQTTVVLHNVSAPPASGAREAETTDAPHRRVPSLAPHR
jgi:small-conductance mechanosensitive channel